MPVQRTPLRGFFLLERMQACQGSALEAAASSRMPVLHRLATCQMNEQWLSQPRYWTGR